MTDQEIELRTIKDDIKEIKTTLTRMRSIVERLEALHLTHCYDVETIPQTQACNEQGVSSLKL